MAVDPRKRQRKLERRKKKDAAERKTRVQQKSLSPAVQLARSSGMPILDCQVGATLWDKGIGNLLLSRVIPGGRVAFVVFLVDVSCLGVKDVTFGVASRQQYQDSVVKGVNRSAPPKKISPAYARKLVESAVVYAGSLGLPPHSDYAAASLIFGDIDSSSCDETFTFGRNGKPLFVAGPNDSREKCRRIMASLLQHCGDGNYHYVVRVAPEELDSAEFEMIEHDATTE